MYKYFLKILYFYITVYKCNNIPKKLYTSFSPPGETLFAYNFFPDSLTKAFTNYFNQLIINFRVPDGKINKRKIIFGLNKFLIFIFSFTFTIIFKQFFILCYFAHPFIISNNFSSYTIYFPFFVKRMSE